jgi:hypothetical protein
VAERALSSHADVCWRMRMLAAYVLTYAGSIRAERALSSRCFLSSSLRPHTLVLSQVLWGIEAAAERALLALLEVGIICIYVLKLQTLGT